MRRPPRSILVTAVVVLLLAAAGLPLGLGARHVAGTAAIGKAQAEAGVKALESLDTTTAVSQFGAATQNFTSVTRSLGPDWFAVAVESIPWVGRQYATARSLARIGLDSSIAQR